MSSGVGEVLGRDQERGLSHDPTGAMKTTGGYQNG